MYLILAEGYTNAGVEFLKVPETGEIWPSMEGVRNCMGVKKYLT